VSEPRLPEPTDEEKKLVALAAIGRQLEDFSNTKAFLWLVDQAHDMKEKSLELLVKVNPMDTPKIMAAQRDALVADRFIDWVQQGIQTGVNAVKELDARSQPSPD
jgi:hypothetical protein